jgi:hypothetical protein
MYDVIITCRRGEGWTLFVWGACATTADDAVPCSGWARVCVLYRMRLYALLVAAVLSSMSCVGV